MRRTSMRLADGRELVYFDESDAAVRTLVDPRELAPADRAAPPDLRHDVLLDEWVAVAAHRQTRTHLPPTDDCPLCPSTPGRPTEIPSSDYDVVVFENRFPSFAAGRGRCEVVCFTADHTTSFAALPPSRVRTVLEAWVDRTAELGRLPGVEQVFPFENRGAEIGVTLSHPHGQVYGYPFVTPVTRRLLSSARAHRERTGGNLFDEVLAAEQAAEVRVVARTEHWTAFVPAAARWPFEVHLYPHRRVPDLTALDERQSADFSHVYPDVLRRFDALFGLSMPYVAGWYQAPVHAERDLAALHLRVFSSRRAPDRLKYLAGSESAMGAFVNDVVPEHAAALLREAGR